MRPYHQPTSFKIVAVGNCFFTDKKYLWHATNKFTAASCRFSAMTINYQPSCWRKVPTYHDTATTIMFHIIVKVFFLSIACVLKVQFWSHLTRRIVFTFYVTLLVIVMVFWKKKKHNTTGKVMECTKDNCTVNRFPHLSYGGLQLLLIYHGPLDCFTEKFSSCLFCTEQLRRWWS